ncbi:MAG: glycosyltransferase family 2 protein [Bacteroidales bacterium]|nr:glycosyltransferase family 2 protein [Bacteroidales bacterium]MBS3777256.1 glycosyltransferase family 2 protein [Bacteroidales bacterium]
MKGKVSIIIPCRNEKDHIGACMHSLLNNDYPQKEFIVVDGLSNDGTREIISEFAQRYVNVKLINNSRYITPIALNLGLDEADGEYVLIAGAHATFPLNYITEMVRRINLFDDAAGIGGALNTVAENTLIAQSIVKVITDKMGVGNSMFRVGVNGPVKVDTLPYGLYKKEVFHKIGKYDERLVRNQDIELARRMWRYGEYLYLFSDIKCNYHFKGSFSNLARMNFKNGLWNVFTFYITKHLSSLSTRHYIPLLFVLALLGPVILAFLSEPVFVFVSLTIAVIYFTLIIFKSVKLADKHSRIIYLIWSFCVLHFSYGLGSLLGLFHLKKLFK